MTLTEYCGQSDKCASGSVMLKDNEYKVLQHIPKLGLTAIYLIMFNVTYVKKEGLETLYTTDDHGNPQKPSVFAIAENIEINLK